MDVYAFSMIAYELFEGAIPFEHLHPVEAARRAAMNHARPVWGKTCNRSVTCTLYVLSSLTVPAEKDTMTGIALWRSSHEPECAVHSYTSLSSGLA